MHYSGLDILRLCRTPVGRRALRARLWHATWPVVRPLARSYRAVVGRHPNVVAVTGSVGKTTAVRAVAAALAARIVPALGRNSHNSIPLGMLRTRAHDASVVVEVGVNRPGQMVHHAQVLQPDVAVVTAVASEHNRSFGTLEATRAEKSLIVEALDGSATAVLNADDPHVLWMAGRTRAEVITFGFGPDSDVRATDVRLDWPHGTRFTLHVDGETRHAATRLVGGHSLRAVLAAVGVARALGQHLDLALARLESLPPTPGRMQPIQLGNGVVVLHDGFKSTVETVYAALETLAEIPARRRVVVLGEVSEPPGSQGPLYRDIGARIAATADRAVFITSSRERYTTGAVRRGMPRRALVVAGKSVRAAHAVLERMLEPGDVVLVKGRDTQKLDRVVLLLQGVPVGCDISFCRVKSCTCRDCPMLGPGWGRLKPVTL